MSELISYSVQAALDVEGFDEVRLESLAHGVMQSLLAQEDRSSGMVNSGAVSMALATGELEIEFQLRAGDEAEAQRSADQVIRDALQYAGGMAVQDRAGAARTLLTA